MLLTLLVLSILIIFSEYGLRYCCGDDDTVRLRIVSVRDELLLEDLGVYYLDESQAKVRPYKKEVVTLNLKIFINIMLLLECLAIVRSIESGL
jgi:hypothetical protein